jgi:hypothetical protein
MSITDEIDRRREAKAEADTAHELAEAMRCRSLDGRQHILPMERLAAEQVDATRWLAAETRAARLERRLEVGGG